MRCKTPKQADKDRPLKVNVIYAPPSAEADECWLRALKILMEVAPEPEKERDHEQHSR